ncbi:MAG: DUF3048 domain-containing protein [Patescibacteria group bacterium]
MEKSKIIKSAKQTKVVKVKVKKAPAIRKIQKQIKKIKLGIISKAVTPSVFVIPPQKKVKSSYATIWQYAAWFSGVLVVVMLVGTIMVVNRPNAKVIGINSFDSLINQNDVRDQAAPVSFISGLTGEVVTQEVAERRPLAVMIENFYTVRPQSGLSFADLVWEVPTEGGVTRFLAVFQKGLPSRIGPVRSARSYFIDWARELGAFYAHSGGADDALDELARGVKNLQDVNEFLNEYAYSRDNKEARPHNLYTAAELFYSYAEKNGWRITSELNPWQFVNSDSLTNTPKSVADKTANEILIPYFPLEYDVLWKYKVNDGIYERWMDGKLHQDRITGGILQAKNVIVMFTDVVPVPRDPKLRVNIRTVGSGPAYLFTNGEVYQGEWQKKSLESRTEFLDKSGQLLQLNPGITWISVMDKGLEQELEYK